MHVDIDEYAHLESVMHRMDARAKIVSLFTAILLISSCTTASAAFISLCFSVAVCLFSGLPLPFFLNKIRYPLLFLLPLFLFLPFSSGGDVLTRFYWLTIYSTGLLKSLLISIKVVAIVLLVNIMSGTASFRRNAAALKALHVPDKMLNIILFTYRYFFVFSEDLRKMRIALNMRGAARRGFIRSMGSAANLAGSLLVRSYEQTERIYQAMMLRGYQGRIITDEIFSLRLADVMLSIVLIVMPLAIMLAEQFGYLYRG